MVSCLNVFIRFLLAETVGIPYTNRLQYYEADAMPFYFDLISITRDTCKTSLAECFLNGIQIGLNTSGHWPNFVVTI